LYTSEEKGTLDAIADNIRIVDSESRQEEKKEPVAKVFKRFKREQKCQTSSFLALTRKEANSLEVIALGLTVFSL
jgi:hypothetical protein